MKRPLLLALAPLALGLIGCPPIGIDCTLEARVSVSVTVVAEGASLDAAEVAYRGPDDTAWTDCESWMDGEWACGYEVAGEIEVRATADGYEEAIEIVSVDSDECHVITEALEIELLPTT